jgi:ribose transport system ATP-binding protein
MTDLLLDASGVSKNYGGVAALRDATLSVQPGEVHALLGANGAGKSTLVKVLTGVVHPDSGTIRVRGQARAVHSPAEARRSGLVSVYQEPSLIPDLDIASNLRLTSTPLDPFRDWLVELGVPTLALSDYVRELPLAVLRVIDLARALASNPDILLLDEMTAALPADLTERVLDVVGRQRQSGRSVIFISHRLVEVTALCDRATVLRDGETVGVVDMAAGAQERIVSLMLGPAALAPPATTAVPALQSPVAAIRSATPPEARLTIVDLQAGTKLQGVSFDLHVGEVLGIVALEDQGQDELFEVLAGSRRPDGGEVRVDGRAVRFRHPADAIRAGLVFVPANRAEALLPQRSIRENIALPFSARPRHWGPIDMGAESRRVGGAIDRLQIDTRAQSEVRRLSGGNQQKVTIARWIAGGVRTLLCFDPTRGIDIRTKGEIYQLLRDLAAAGAAVLLYTSELEEIQLACDRAIVIFGGRVVEEMLAAVADEPALLRAAYGLPPGVLAPEEAAEEEAARAQAGVVT